MLNMFSPYQQRKHGIIATMYCPADVKVLNQKIEYMENLTSKTHPEFTNILNLYISNREFVIRQLNQQMMEKHG